MMVKRKDKRLIRELLAVLLHYANTNNIVILLVLSIAVFFYMCIKLLVIN